MPEERGVGLPQVLADRDPGRCVVELDGGCHEAPAYRRWARTSRAAALPIAQVFRNTNDFFTGRIEQAPEYGEICRWAATKRLQWLDEELASRDFLAVDRSTIADITALVGIDFGRVVKLGIADHQKNLKRWHAAVSSRPSACA